MRLALVLLVPSLLGVLAAGCERSADPEALVVRVRSEEPSDGGGLDAFRLRLAQRASGELVRWPHDPAEATHEVSPGVAPTVSPVVVRLRHDGDRFPRPAEVTLEVTGLRAGRVRTRTTATVDLDAKRVVEVTLARLAESCDADADGFVDCTAEGCGDCGAASPLRDCAPERPGAHPWREGEPCEACGDGIDQDCDGADRTCADDDGDGVADCREARAECGVGNPEVAPGLDERCDGLDNDCDGDTDEGFGLGADCGRGACEDGTVECSVDGSGTRCSTMPAGESQEAPGSEAAPQPEGCNGVDDDCDGSTDEGLSWKGRPVGSPCEGRGACGEGVVECAGDGSATCSTNPAGSEAGNQPETCNGADDDCDGDTDEAFAWNDAAVGASCDGRGACGEGIVECLDAGGGATCSTNPTGSTPEDAPEICNGVDDDCDGDTDEGLADQAEVCNDGLDNDCDGATDCADEACLGAACPEGFECTAEGRCLDEQADQVWVPPGPFQMGCNEEALPGDAECPPEYLPQHEVQVPGFAMDRTEITHEEYESCVTGGPCTPTAHLPDVPESSNLPEAGMSWDQASSYCQWQGGRLCTAAEWEKAARGGCEQHCQADDAACCKASMPLYPWGNEKSDAICSQEKVHSVACPGNDDPLSSVGSHPNGASPYGVLDLIGNVSEWVADCEHDGYGGAPTDGSAWLEDCADDERVVRGITTEVFTRTSVSLGAPPHLDQALLGARCCRSLCGDASSTAIREVCNGADDDCDGSVDEDVGTGAPCDGTDADECADGVTKCVEGIAFCTDNESSANETCNEADDDCDGQTDEAPGQCRAAVCGTEGIASCPAGFECDSHGKCIDSGEAASVDDDEVWVPGGTFWMGCNDALDDGCDSTEQPQHEVEVSSFAIGRTEVTRYEYESCVNDGACPPLPSTPLWEPLVTAAPATDVSWQAASAYCEWQGARLCSEVEWAAAARGTCALYDSPCEDAIPVYPWGSATPSCEFAAMKGTGELCATVATELAEFHHPLSIGSRPAGASPFGALDMAGNVAELVADDWHPSFSDAPSDDAPWLDEGTTSKVLRGGTYEDGANSLRAGERASISASDANESTGFRCCRTVP